MHIMLRAQIYQDEELSNVIDTMWYRISVDHMLIMSIIDCSQETFLLT